VFTIARFCFRLWKKAHIYVYNIRFNIKTRTKRYDFEILKWVNAMSMYLYVCIHIYAYTCVDEALLSLRLEAFIFLEAWNVE